MGQAYYHRIFGQYYKNLVYPFISFSEDKTEYLLVFIDLVCIYFPINFLAVGHTKKVIVSQFGYTSSYESFIIYNEILVLIFIFSYFAFSHAVVVVENFYFSLAVFMTGVAATLSLDTEASVEFLNNSDLLLKLLL